MTKPAPVSDEDRANLIAYLDGELDGEAARAWGARLSTDPAARAEAEALRRTWQLLDYLPRPEPSAAFTSQTLERVSALRPVAIRSALRPPLWRRPWVLGAGWAASVLLAGVIGFLTVRSMRPAAEPAPAAEEPADSDQQLVRDLRVIENQRLYEHVGTIDFLRKLDAPDLFGDDSDS